MNDKAISLYLSSDLVRKIEEYQQQNYISTRNAAIVQLITKSLGKHEERRVVDG